jgi:hypothetical protein
VGEVVRAQHPGAGKLVRVVEGEKLNRRWGKTHFNVSCKQTRRPEKVGAVSPLPVCLEKGKLVAEALAHRRTLSKQSLWGQVSAKLTPEICINNASSNNRLTALGRQATATDTIHRTVSRFSLSFFSSLPTSDEKTTELHLHAEKLT